MYYIATIILTIICTLLLGIFKKYAIKKPKSYLYVVSSIAVIVSLAIGLLLGTAYNHSVDIPWWIFSILSFIIIVLPSIVVLGILRIRLFILRKYKS